MDLDRKASASRKPTIALVISNTARRPVIAFEISASAMNDSFPISEPSKPRLDQRCLAIGVALSAAFEARTKYLRLAGKAVRTVIMLTERLDHHRGRGQQQITVKHVTVNADQAIVAENVTTAAPALQGNAPSAIEQILPPQLVGTGRGQKPK